MRFSWAAQWIGCAIASTASPAASRCDLRSDTQSKWERVPGDASATCLVACRGPGAQPSVQYRIPYVAFRRLAVRADSVCHEIAKARNQTKEISGFCVFVADVLVVPSEERERGSTSRRAA